MKILMVNKFLHPNGGSETYIFKLGKYLQSQGHEVEYFGMEHPKRCVGNSANAYTSNIDFHTLKKIQQLNYSVKSIYSIEARKKIRLVLDSFQPQVIHINNFTYQLTPSIILEIVKWRKVAKRNCRIVVTVHDAQLICPNHMLNNPNTHELCEKCLGGKYGNCIRGKCIHGSTAKSLIGATEASFWNIRKTYKYVDAFICPSRFLKEKMDTNPVFSNKTIVLQNFIEKPASISDYKKKNYVLYFGRYSEEKGINTFARATQLCPNINFICAGSGPLEDTVNTLPNVKNVGFKTGHDLDMLIGEAMLSLCPSEVHENCPFSVMESMERGTPVIGAKVGGIPELIADNENGRLFEYKNSEMLASIIQELMNNQSLIKNYSIACKQIIRNGLPEYYEKLMSIYGDN